ncbi:MAG TPA: Sec-independent protein translocase protein TatB [Allosphingosinicella sp.]|nr:Sec-independent protein translocase protein TatB [Allosphingosinicella sp.]
MFGVDSSELLIIVLVAVVIIGPKDLPRVLRTVGQWVGKARGMANQFRSGVDQMMRETEIAELEQKWREQNEAIMRAHPEAPEVSDWGLPTPPGNAPVSLDKPAEAPVSLSKQPDAAVASAPPRAVPPLVQPAYPVPRSAAGGDSA